MTVEGPKKPLENGGQVLKTRDDHAPVFLDRQSPAPEADTFQMHPDSKCSWAKPGETFSPERLRPRIEPWLTALVQSEHLSLLIGSGLTPAVHWLAKDDASPERKQVDAVRQGLKDVLQTFASSILKGEHNIATANAENREEAFNYHV